MCLHSDEVKLFSVIQPIEIITFVLIYYTYIYILHNFINSVFVIGGWWVIGPTIYELLEQNDDFIFIQLKIGPPTYLGIVEVKIQCR